MSLLKVYISAESVDVDRNSTICINDTIIFAFINKSTKKFKKKVKKKVQKKVQKKSSKKKFKTLRHQELLIFS